jgi:hypothetical protein
MGILEARDEQPVSVSTTRVDGPARSRRLSSPTAVILPASTATVVWVAPP